MIALPIKERLMTIVIEECSLYKQKAHVAVYLSFDGSQ